MDEKKSIIRKIPGFSSGTGGKMMLAYLGYSLIFVIILSIIFLPPLSTSQTQSIPPSHSTIPTLVALMSEKEENILNISSSTEIVDQKVNTHKFESGDVIQRTESDSYYNKNIEYVILSVNENGQYLIGKLNYDLYDSVWYKVNEDSPRLMSFGTVEREYPVFLKNINWDNVPVKYEVKSCDGNTILSWDPNSPNCYTPSQTDGYWTNIHHGLCWKPASFRDGTYISGYWRKC
jgi:hypothetical protein